MTSEELIKRMNKEKLPKGKWYKNIAKNGQKAKWIIVDKPEITENEYATYGDIFAI